MKVFISWSGERSKAVALALRQWLPDVIQSVEPWVSAEDIEAGTRWGSHIATELSETRFGIICLTRDNQTAPWILFEAGALAKTIENTFVVPYLIDLEPADIQRGPLNQFQAKRANELETFDLIRTMNRAHGNVLTDDQLQRAFNRCWPELDVSLKSVPVQEEREAGRSLEDMVGEILDLVRQKARAPQVVRPDPVDITANYNEMTLGELLGTGALRVISPKTIKLLGDLARTVEQDRGKNIKE